LEHRVGGLEKDIETGDVSYDPINHEKMMNLRQQKIDIIADELPPVDPFGDKSGKVLVVGWGSSFGAIREAVNRSRKENHTVGHVHLRHLNPFPPNLGETLLKYQNILVPEMNSGQLLLLLRGKFLIDASGLNKVQGKPLGVDEVYDNIIELAGA